MGSHEGAKARRGTRREVAMDVFEFRERREKRADDGTEQLATAVIGAAIEVHRLMGPGLPEISYKKALSHELTLRGIPHECEFPVPIVYKGVLVGEGRVDILVDRRLVLEIKVAETLTPVHRAQCLTYLQALRLELGILLNFNVTVMRDGIKRVINTF
jgi:GxxExxY protein